MLSLVLLDIDLVARTGGIRFLLHALGEGPLELAPILAATFLSIIDSPRTRSYLTVGTDLEVCNLALVLHPCLLPPLDRAVRDNRRIWQRPRPCRTDARMRKGDTTHATYLERYVVVIQQET